MAAAPIILKKSSTSDQAPAAASLQPGELAINLADKKLYSKTTTGTVIELGGTTGASVTFNNGGAGSASGAAFNGSAAFTVSYNTIGAPSVTGAGASGSWGISVTGNAATATALQTARTINGVSFNGSANITIPANTTSALTFNNGGSGAASGSSFNGASALTISYNTLGAPSVTGAGASGTWAISISGTASVASTANALNSGSYYGVERLGASGNGLNATITARTPNNATTGGFQLQGNATSGNAVFQVTNLDGTVQWGAATITSSGTWTWTGGISGTVVSASSQFSGPGTGLTGTASSLSIGGNAATATALQTARTINGVSFNGSANISVNLNNTVAFNNVGSGAASGATFNGSAALTISYNTIGAAGATGAGASGTWGISITGNAATASVANSLNSSGAYVAQRFNATGDGSNATITAATPNASTTGGFQLQGNVTTGKAYFQVVNSTAASQWGYWEYDSTGIAKWSGTLSISNGVTGTLPIANGGTGSTTASGARTNLGLAAVASSGSFSDLTNTPGIRSNGEQVISSTVTLGSSHKGMSSLIVTSGITITFPASGFASGEGVAISNISGGSVTLAFPGGSDMGTTLPANGSFFAFCNGAGFWRQFCYSTSRL